MLKVEATGSEGGVNRGLFREMQVQTALLGAIRLFLSITIVLTDIY